MSDEIDDYLRSKVLYWEPNRRRSGGADLPKLTIGGLLLSMRRLETVRECLSHDHLATLSRSRQELFYQKREWRLRYQSKLARELRSRLDVWAWYLDDVKQQGESAIAHYPWQVETRAKIDLLLDEAREVRLEVDESRRGRAALDQRLRGAFTKGEFCWPDELAPGFPKDRFWYLYGSPQEY